MSTKPSVEARLLIEDPRYESYRVGLEAKREVYVRALLRPNQDHVRMSRLAGQVSAIDFALGLPAVLLESDPRPSSPEE